MSAWGNVDIERTSLGRPRSSFAIFLQKRVEGLIIGDDPFLISQRNQIVALAARHAVPTAYFSRGLPNRAV
jgi:hypothetical protein